MEQGVQRRHPGHTETRQRGIGVATNRKGGDRSEDPMDQDPENKGLEEDIESDSRKSNGCKEKNKERRDAAPKIIDHGNFFGSLREGFQGRQCIRGL